MATLAQINSTLQEQTKVLAKEESLVITVLALIVYLLEFLTFLIKIKRIVVIDSKKKLKKTELAKVLKL